MINAARQQHLLMKSALAIFFGVLIFGTVLFHYIESWNYVDSFYFTTTTVTSLGYGDIVPTTPLSKIITSLFAIMGIALVLTVLSAFAGTFISFNKSTQKLHKKIALTNKNLIEKPLKRVGTNRVTIGKRLSSLKALRLRKQEENK